MFEARMKSIVESFDAHGAQLVSMLGYAEGTDLHYKCFCNVPKPTVYEVLQKAVANMSLMPHDLASVMNGDIVVQPPDEALCVLVRWAANQLEMHEPMIIMALREGEFCAFVVGDIPMLVYMGTRMITTLKDDVDRLPGSFYTSDN